MRIVAWNCQMAFRRKYEAIEAFKPDILVISECESPEFLIEKKAELPWQNQVWIGKNRTKGLSVFAREGISLDLHPSYKPRLQFVAPVSVRSEHEAFNLYALWTQGHKTPSKAYVNHSLNALRAYGKSITESCIWAGDFNSNPVFKYSGVKHLLMVERFEKRGLTSAYHNQSGETHGEETQPSFYLHRDRAKPYHLDYLFCHQRRIAQVQMGQPDDWLELSDHMPLIVDLI